MNNSTVKSFEAACDIYRAHGVDPVSAIEKLKTIPVSLHAWQGDDVVGFENFETALTGGCQVTGNYPGRARTADELRDDLDLVLKLVPGKSRVCLQGHQVDRMIPGVDRDGFTIEHFSNWLAWAKEKNIGLDIAPCYYSHPKLDHGLSLSHPDAGIRKFWIDHGKAIRRIGEEFGKTLGTPAVCNFWMPDGFKDIPADRYAPRLRLAESLDTIFSDKIDEKYLLDAVESKLFGIGVESCTVGSHDFYLMYAAQNNKLICLDSGHFHPTESIADKLSAIVARQGRILLHVSRGVRWDSDHVILLNDELLSIAREAAVYGFIDKIFFCLDYFDASINRIGAMVVGARNMQKALLIALLEPTALLKKEEDAWDFTSRMARQEEIKTLPWSAVWRYYCESENIPDDFSFMQEIKEYEKKITNRN
ncbi:MAG: L-rhamnose isomerase [Lentisphaeria bacterium]|nr:L-rhamnose isomerase [Lentisphaeria bacterium]MBO5764745.1 L-rhamnose isomerase [Lentisphaeria bacterium]